MKKWHLDKMDDLMCEWAYNYLKRRFNLPLRTSFTSHYDACTALLNDLQGNEAKELLLNKMRDAWRQKQHRDKQGKRGRKSCSFILSTTALNKLHTLAKGLGAPINETLERVINETYLADKELKKQARKKSPFTSSHTLRDR